MGIDPSTRSLGWALFDTDSVRFVGHGTKKVIGADADERCDALPNLLRELLPFGCNVDAVAIERMFSTGRNADAPLAVVAYLMRRRCRSLGVPYVEIPPATAKKRVVGNGTAAKAQVRAHIEARFGESFDSTDAADAACVALAAVDEVETLRAE